MPLPKYYCDYCDKQFQDTPSARKRHLHGLQHQRARKQWFDSFKDPQQLQAENLGKGICVHFLKTGFCQYGDKCKYFHPVQNIQQHAGAIPGESSTNMQATAVDSTQSVNIPGNIQLGVPLTNLLYTRRSIALTLQEQAATTYANLAASAALPEGISDTLVTLLESDEVIYHLLSLINLTGPAIQGNILRAFHAMCRLPAAGEVRAKLREGGAIQVLLPFCESSNLDMRANAVKLLFSLSQDGDGGTLVEHLGQKYTENLVKLLSTSLNEEEKAAALGVIANLPLASRQITQWLVEAGALSMIVSILSSGSLRTTGNTVKNQLVENAAGALSRFTIPTDTDLQLKTAQSGVIPILVRLLGSGTPLAKCRAAISLAQFSQNSEKLSRPIRSRRGFMCFSAPPQLQCRVHGGVCSVTTSFCLVEADAIIPLVQALEEQEGGTSEAALEALSTLVYDEYLQKGAKEIEAVDGIKAIVRLLTVGSTGVQEKAVWILERVFRNERYRIEYGNAAQMPLVDLTQRGTSATRPLAAKILAHLNVLHDQSSYF